MNRDGGHPEDQRGEVGGARLKRREFLARTARLGVAVAMFPPLLAACGGDDGGGTGGGGGGGGGAEEEFRVGFVYLGPPGDAGWTFQHDQSRKHLESEISSVKTVVIENVPEANAGPALDQLIAQGCKLIFATSFGYGDAVLQRAQQHPEVKFEHCSGIKQTENVATYYGKHWDPMWVIGFAAGKLSKSGRLGFVGSFPIPDVKVDANAFTLGARAANPAATTQVILINSWYDPPKEKQAARTLVDAGADVLSGVEDSPSILQEAANHPGVLSATWNSDMSKFAPDAFVSAVVFDWRNYVVQRTQEAIDGTWKSQDFWGGVNDGMVALAPWGKPVPSSLRADLEEKYDAVKSGSLSAFEGPLSDAGGKERVAEGSELSFGEILGMNWYVEGVRASD